MFYNISKIKEYKKYIDPKPKLLKKYQLTDEDYNLRQNETK